MAQISEDDTFTQVVRFDVTSETQMALIDAIASEVERWVRHRAGFISSSFHASCDGKHVLNYAQWASESDFDAFTRDPETARLGQAIRRIDPALEPHAIHYRVVRSISRR